MQGVALVLWAKFEQFREDGDFRSWAMGIARYEVLTWLRDRGRDRVTAAEERTGHQGSRLRGSGPVA